MFRLDLRGIITEDLKIKLEWIRSFFLFVSSPFCFHKMSPWMSIGKLDKKECHSAGQPRKWQVFPGIAMMRSNSPQPALFADLLIRFNFTAATAQGSLTMYDSMWQKNILILGFCWFFFDHLMLFQIYLKPWQHLLNLPNYFSGGFYTCIIEPEGLGVVFMCV